MLTLTTNMVTALQTRTSAASISRVRTILFEIYSSDTYPDVDGLFDPADAIALWAKASTTWLGLEYQRRVVSHSGFSRHMSGEFDSVSLTIENADRYFSAFLATNNVDGTRLVCRYINDDLSDTLEDSVVCFVGRLQAPEGDIDREQGDLTAQEELASLDREIGSRRVSAHDPNGRSPNDPRFQGFAFTARPSSIRYSVTEMGTRFGFLPKKKEQIKHAQWSSQSGSEDAVLPLISGRVQLAGLETFWTDIDFFIIGIWVFAGHKITAIRAFQLPDPNYIFYGPWATELQQQEHVHLGDLGGTGTNATPDTIEDTYPQNKALLSGTAYVGFAIGGPEAETQPFANPQMDDVPTLVAIVLGESDLPDGFGVFNQKGFTDSPVYAARRVLVGPEYFGLDPRLVYDGELPAIHAERSRPIIDRTNGELLFLTAEDAAYLSAGRLTRVSSTGLLDSRYYRHLLDSAYPDPLITNIANPFPVSTTTPDVLVGGDHALINGVTLTGQSVTVGAWKYYQFEVPLGTEQLLVVATGAGDAELYTAANRKPTQTDYDGFAYNPSPEVLTHSNPVAGIWWFGVRGRTGTTTFTILATATGGTSGLVVPIKPRTRKAWTFNVPLTDTSNASDFFHDVVLASGRLYKVTDSAGRIDIRQKKSADSSYLIADAADTDTSVLVGNVEPWIASVQGYLLIGVGSTTSETRAITDAEYDPTTGDAITLAVSGTGLTASGATLAGGSSSLPSSGTVTVSSLAAVGTLLTVTVWGIPITYTIDSEDDRKTIAAQITDLINADPNLRQYVRATWNGAYVCTIYSTVGVLSFATGLANDHVAQVDSPVTAPTASATGSGTLDPGDYFLGYSLVDGSGNETLMSPLKRVTIAASQKVSVTSLGALPSGAAEVNWYFSPAVGDDDVRKLLTNAGGAFTIDDVANFDEDFPSSVNSTGGETIRIREVFNQFNTRVGSLKAVPSRSKINQVSGYFIDSANGFKRTQVIANDKAHQDLVKKINKKEISLSGVDNFSQASRLVHATLAEERDGGKRWKWRSDDGAIPLEIGDVVAINEYKVNLETLVTENILVNQPVMIEDWNLQEDFDVALTGMIYSSSLLEGQVGRKPIVVATTLKYLTDPPPVATDLVLTQADNYLTGILVDFEFGDFVGGQLAHVFMKGPSFVLPAVEPDDSEYKLVDTVYPDANQHGHLQIRATSAGTYWIKVVTQSAYGRSATTGHPEASILIRPNAPTGFTLVKLSNNDRVETWQPGIEGSFLPETYIMRVRDSSTNALKRTATITVGEHSLPAKWTYSGGTGDQSKVTISSDDGSISAVASTVTQVYYDSQVFYGNGDVEFEVDDRLIFNFALINDGTFDTPAHVDSSYARGAGVAFIQFADVDATSAWRRRLNAKTKITLRIRNNTIEYRYDDTFWAFAGLLSPAPAATFFLRAYFFSATSDLPMNEAQAYLKVRFLPLQPRQWVYTDGMARQDFGGSNPATVKFEITQISASGIESLPATVTG